MSRRIIYILSFLLLVTTWGSAQSFCHFRGYIEDAQEKEPLPFASIRMKSDDGKYYGGTSDQNGKFNITGLKTGRYHVTVSYIGYEKQEESINLKESITSMFSLQPSSTTLNEVVVTASESRGITSASKIDRTAMEHLQPSSFTDLLALLPGGSTSPPNMSKANTIRLREVGIGKSDFSTSSLGTQFIIDGTPVSTSANMQSVASDITTAFDGYSSVNAGVDMRNISTDNIENVEIIRGIPSVQYNNLTSGAVIIKLKQKATPLEARFKADQTSKLFSVGKGVEWKDKGITLSADMDYLDAKNDPRNRYSRYKRITTSVRLNKKWALNNGYALEWQTRTNYAVNVDNVKNDPDIEKLQEDSYRSSYHAGGWHNILEWTAPGEKAFRKLTLNMSADMSWDKIKRSRFIQLDRDRVVPTNMEEGEHDAEILPYQYTAYSTVDGKPVNLYAKASTEFRLLTGLAIHKLLAGAVYTYDKNFGDGQVYDLTRPLDPTYHSLRPRKYSDIPASAQWRMYIEDNIGIPVGRNYVELQAGISSNMMMNLDKRYALSGKMFFDPRFNVQWKFPGISVGRQELKISLSAGIGWLTLMPTLAQLHPDNLYMDFLQLNYWNANAAYKRINLRTYIVNPTNYDLQPARNFKWEVRMGMEYHKNTLSVTYFRERMNSAFRSIATYSPYEYKEYDSSNVDGSALTAPPSLEDMPYAMKSVLKGYGYTGNGSRIQKEGVEFQIASERFKALNTRFTVNGAWLRTIYENSEPIFKSVSKVVNGIALSDEYVGFYEVDDSYHRERFNTNFTVDTWLEELGLKFSTTAECTWFSSQQTPKRSGTPIAYMDVMGNVSPYTEADRNDVYKQHLVISNASSVLAKTTTPFYMYINFKATKELGKSVLISLFANRILDYVPDYTRNGYLIRRTAEEPYFGMELNLKLY